MKKKKSLIGWIEKEEFELYWVLESSYISIPHFHTTKKDYEFMHPLYKIDRKNYEQKKRIPIKVRITIEEI